METILYYDSFFNITAPQANFGFLTNYGAMLGYYMEPVSFTYPSTQLENFKNDGSPLDFLLGEDGDLRFNNNSPTVTRTLAELVKQRLLIRLSTNLTEWKFNVRFGTPYFTEGNSLQILGKSSKGYVDAVLSSTILEEVYVSKILSFNSSLDRNERTYTMTASVELTDGSVIEVGTQI